jgi:hypothetical protein
MREVPVLDTKGKKIENHATYSEIVAEFIKAPTVILNN